MPSTKSFPLAKLALLASLVGAPLGCGSPPVEVSKAHTHLSWLGHMYAMYLGQHKGQPPQSIDDLRTFVEKRTTAEELSRLKVASIEELFVSPRDGKPFQMVVHKDLGRARPAGGMPPPVEAPPVVLYEQVGQGGERAIVYLGGHAETVDNQELQNMLPAGSG